jgi:hypothetical protein
MICNSKRTTKHIGGITVYLVLLFLLQIFHASAQTFSAHTYAADNSNVANPERGFYHHTETNSGSYSFLNETTLRSYRTQGITLILRVFYLNDFVNKPIPEQYLASMRQDFNTARAAGVKIIVRFAYTKKSTAPYGDATPAWVLQHIEQLAPVLKQNGDVIAVVQAGFVGAWGEWYYTDHFSATLGSPNAADWQNRRSLINALLAATPSNRSVQVRTPAIKFSLLESNEPLQASEAFTATPKARVGHHNDCFLASVNDFGTYTGNMDAEKAFLETETQFLPMGGETCNESVPLSEYPNALAQMQRFHWSYLNRDYHSGVLGSWQDGHCMPEVFQKLGYRIRMVKSLLQENSKPGGVVNFTIKLLNDGWATPYNPRRVEIVLKNTQTGKTFILPVQDDPRRWPLSDTIQIHAQGGLPKQTEPGEYKVFLHLPDPEKTLYGNPEYAIRLTNMDTWQPETGFNDLQHTLIVGQSAAVPDYMGSDYFKALPAVGENAAIQSDGNAGDWQPVPVLTDGQSPLHTLKVFNTADDVFFLVKGISDIQSFEIKVDVDHTSATGELSAPWNSNHADYRITNSGISFYQGGAWSVPQAVTTNLAGDVLEVGVPKILFSTTSISDQIDVAVKVVTPGETIYLPAENNAFASYRMLLTDKYSLHATSSGNKVILYWANESPELYRTIERAVQNDVYSKIAVVPGSSFSYIDQVADNSVVKYRTYLSSTDGFNVSNYSLPIEETTSARPLYYTFVADGAPDEWEDVVPLTTVPHESTTQAYRVFVSAEKLNILFEGDEVDAYSLYLDMDNNVSTGSPNNPWMYAGFDYLFQNDSLYDVRSNVKIFIVKGSRSASTGYLEVAVPVSAFDNLANNTMMLTAGKIALDGTDLFFPATDETPLKFLRVLPSPTPSSVSVSNSENLPESQLIVQWQGCTGCKGFIVERADNSPEIFSVVATKNAFTYAYYDNNLVAGRIYYYKVSSYNEAGPSVPSEVVSGTPNTITSVEGDGVQDISAYPNPTTGYLYIETKIPGLKTLHVIDATGQSWLHQNLSSETLQHRINVSGLPSGIYFVKIDGMSSFIIRIAKQ